MKLNSINAQNFCSLKHNKINSRNFKQASDIVQISRKNAKKAAGLMAAISASLALILSGCSKNQTMATITNKQETENNIFSKQIELTADKITEFNEELDKTIKSRAVELAPEKYHTDEYKTAKSNYKEAEKKYEDYMNEKSNICASISYHEHVLCNLEDEEMNRINKTPIDEIEKEELAKQAERGEELSLKNQVKLYSDEKLEKEFIEHKESLDEQQLALTELKENNSTSEKDFEDAKKAYEKIKSDIFASLPIDVKFNAMEEARKEYYTLHQQEQEINLTPEPYYTLNENNN